MKVVLNNCPYSEELAIYLPIVLKAIYFQNTTNSSLANSNEPTTVGLKVKTSLIVYQKITSIDYDLMHFIYFNKLKTQHQILIINLQTYQVCNLHACSRATYSQNFLIILLFINNYVALFNDQKFCKYFA